MGISTIPPPRREPRPPGDPSSGQTGTSPPALRRPEIDPWWYSGPSSPSNRCLPIPPHPFDRYPPGSSVPGHDGEQDLRDLDEAGSEGDDEKGGKQQGDQGAAGHA